MTDVSHSGRAVTIGEETVLVDRPVKKTVEHEGVVFVLLGVPVGTVDPTNVVGFDHDGNRLWEIAAVGHENPDVETYVNLTVDHGRVVVHTFAGGEYWVDPETGAIEFRRFRRM